MKNTNKSPKFGRSSNSSAWATQIRFVAVSLVFTCLCLCISSLVAQDAESPESPTAVCRDLVSRFESPEFAREAGKELVAKKDTIVGWAADLDDDLIVQYAAGLACLSSDPEKSVSFFRQAFELSGNHPSIVMQYTTSLKMTRRPLDAMEVMKKTVEANPDIPQLQLTLGMYHANVQQYKEALVLFENFVGPIPQPVPESSRRDLATVRILLGKTLLYLGKHEEAIKLLEEANTILPKAAGVLLPLGEAYLKVGDQEKAKARLESALEVNEEMPGTLYWLGVANEEENPAKAKSYFEKALQFGVPRLERVENGDELFLMHQVALKLGKQAEATKYKNEAETLGFRFEAPWASK